MARTAKKGLDYFPLDVNFFDDKKIQFVYARFQVKGVYIAIRLLRDIYKDEGYYIKWTDDDALLFATHVGDGITHALVNDVVGELLKRGFFNEGIFKKFKVLTSAAIQKRYSKICKDAKRKDWEILRKYELIGLNPEEKPLTPEFIDKTQEEILQRKVKERKVKESIYSSLADKSVSWEQIEAYLKFYEWSKIEAPRIWELDEPITPQEYFRILSDGYDKKLIQVTCVAMQNRKTLLKDYKSANLTLRNWMDRRKDDAAPAAQAQDGISKATLEMINGK